MAGILANNRHDSGFVMIMRPIVIDGILKGVGSGGFSGGTDGSDGQRIAILAGVVEEGITRGSLKNNWVREVQL